MIGEQTKELLCEVVKAELASCIDKYGYFHSHHEAWAVMMEEVQEVDEQADTFMSTARKEMQVLWEDVKLDKIDAISLESIERVRKVTRELVFECVQVLAMCDKWENFIVTEREELV